MTEKILQVKSPIVHSDSITDQQYHTYTPYTTSFNNNDEIRIVIQSQDLYVLPSESYLLIEIAVSKKDNVQQLLVDAQAQGLNVNVNPLFTSNFILHMFSEIRYELNGFELDRCKLPAITNILKSMIALKPSDKSFYELATVNSSQIVNMQTYNMIVPLKFLFGFCDDFNKIILNSKHELILVRSRSDINAYIAPVDIVNMKVNKIQWKIQHISLSDAAKLSMLKTLDRNDELPIKYRTWDLYELPIIPQTTRHNWSVKTTTQLTKPRFVVIAFQTNKNFVVNSDASRFDHCDILDLKLVMNNQRFPYDSLNLNFAEEEFRYHELYHLFLQVQQSYYNGPPSTHPLPSFSSFLNHPIFAFDCSRTDESIKSGMVDVRIEIQAKNNIPANTTAYCLIIHDNLVYYSPFTNLIQRSI